MTFQFTNAKFKFGDHVIDAQDVTIEAQAPRPTELGVLGFASGTYEVEFSLLEPPQSLTCKRCGQGRLYSSPHRAWKAMRRWRWHVCPRGAR